MNVALEILQLNDQPLVLVVSDLTSLSARPRGVCKRVNGIADLGISGDVRRRCKTGMCKSGLKRGIRPDRPC